MTSLETTVQILRGPYYLYGQSFRRSLLTYGPSVVRHRRTSCHCTIRTDKQSFLPIHPIARSRFSSCSPDRPSFNATHTIARSAHLPSTLRIHAISPSFATTLPLLFFWCPLLQPVNDFVVAIASQSPFDQSRPSGLLPTCAIHEANASSILITAMDQATTQRLKDPTEITFIGVTNIQRSTNLFRPSRRNDQSDAMQPWLLPYLQTNWPSFVAVQLGFPLRLPSWPIFVTTIHELTMSTVQPNNPLQLPAWPRISTTLFDCP